MLDSVAPKRNICKAHGLQKSLLSCVVPSGLQKDRPEVGDGQRSDGSETGLSSGPA